MVGLPWGIPWTQTKAKTKTQVTLYTLSCVSEQAAAVICISLNFRMMPTKVTPKEMHQECIDHSQATQDQRMSVIAMETWSLAEEFL